MSARALEARLFTWAFSRHCRYHYNADYEVCRDLWCRAAWNIERVLWYERTTP